MPTGHDWEDEEPMTEEDAVKRMLQRAAKLEGPGTVGDLWRLHQNCHKEVFENGNMEHMPMNFVRYQEGVNEKTRELFYICRKCISDYIIQHPECDNNVKVLRGELTPEAEKALDERAEKRFKEEQDRMKEQAKKTEEILMSEQPCPCCGRKMKEHTREDLRSCLKDYVERHE